MSFVYEAGLKDVEEWMQLVDIVGDDFPGLDKDEYRKALLGNISNRTAICARIGDKIVGILLFSLDTSVLEFIAVHPDFRGCGIASEMIGEMLKNFTRNQEVCVTTYRDGDPKGKAARLLYKKLGFIEDVLVEEFGYPCQRFVLRIR